MSNVFINLSLCAHKKADARGSMEVLYESSSMVLKRSFSKKGVFRGMHMQLPPHQQTKLIRVISGRIVDFVVVPDVNANKIHWQEVDVKSDWIQIDSKFAHGFYALEDTHFEYICDGAYNEKAEQSYSIANFLEKAMGIRDFLLSEKDAHAPILPFDPTANIGVY